MNKILAATAAFGLGAVLASCGGGSADPGTSRPGAAGDGGTAAGGGTSSCGLGEGTSGIEGTGLRRKLTGRITDVKSSGAGSNTVVTVGTACFTASGASVFQGSAPASLADLRVDQIIAAEGEFDSTSASYANTIYILQGAGSPSPQSVQELRFAAQRGVNDWGTANWGPEVVLEPSASVIIDGVSAGAGDLVVAADEIALVTGDLTFDSDHNPSGLLSGHRIEINHLLDGPIDALDLANARMSVLGVVVSLDGTTRFEPGSSSLQVGMRVRVSGHPTASGDVAATLVARSDALGDYLVTDFITAIDPAARRLQIGALVVDYASAVLQGSPAQGLRVGDHVRVTGTRTGATLMATSVAYLSPQLPGVPGDLVSLSGIVTGVTSPSYVTVDGYAVTVTDAALQVCELAPRLNAPAALDGMLQPTGPILATDFCAGQAQGHFVGVVTIGNTDYYGDALLTADGSLRLYVGGPYADDGAHQVAKPKASEQFVGNVAIAGLGVRGSGVIIGQECATASAVGPFCGKNTLGNIQLTVTAEGLHGEIQIDGGASASWELKLANWNNFYVVPATGAAIAGQYQEELAEFTSAGDTIITVGPAGSLSLHSTRSGCIGTGTLAPHLDGKFNVYDASFSLHGCMAPYSYLNGAYAGLATTTPGNYWDYDSWLLIWASSTDAAAANTAITMLADQL